MIPIMEREFVDKHAWMDKEEFMDIMVVAQTTPGIFSVDMHRGRNRHCASFDYCDYPCGDVLSRL